jgi:hypothetical protein
MHAGLYLISVLYDPTGYYPYTDGKGESSTCLRAHDSLDGYRS